MKLVGTVESSGVLYHFYEGSTRFELVKSEDGRILSRSMGMKYPPLDLIDPEGSPELYVSGTNPLKERPKTEDYEYYLTVKEEILNPDGIPTPQSADQGAIRA